MTDLTIIVPAYNEAESLKTFFPELIDFATNHKCRIVLVNDGSTDSTKEVLDTKANEHTHIITHRVNKGYGAAIKAAIATVETEYCVTLDADGQHDVNDIPVLYAAMKKNEADLIIGSRGSYKGESITRRLGKWTIRQIAKRLITLPIRDLNTGFKMYRTEVVRRYAPLCPNTFAFADVSTLFILNERHLIVEHPIHIRKRATGKSTISILTAITTVNEILNIITLFNPSRIFLPLSGLFILASICLGVPFLILGRGLSIAASLLATTGVLCFLIGLLCEQISQLRRERIG